MNLGQYPALTFSVWFKPGVGSGANARLFDFGNGRLQNNIVSSRSKTSDAMDLYVIRGSSVNSYATAAGTWASGVWKLFTWTLEPTDATLSTWSVYFDGLFTASVVKFYPVNIDLTSSYIGKSNFPADGVFVGSLDSFVVYPAALKAAEVLALFKVCTHVYTRTLL